MDEQLQLALTVGLIALGSVFVVGVLGYLIDKNSERAQPADRKELEKG